MSNFYSNSYIEYESNGDRNKTLSFKECLDEIKPYLKDIVNNLRKSDALEIQSTMAFSGSKKVICIIKRNNVRA